MGSPAPVNNEDNTSIDTNDLRIPIVGFETMEERARFTVFKLRIENEKLGEKWLVFRRYTDFVRLHNKLKEEFPTLSNKIPLPPKRWFNNFDVAFLEDRMKTLQSFVDTILHLEPSLTHSPTVREFFCLDEPPTYPECSSEESRSMFGTVEENIMHLKQQLTERDLECELLKTELALVTSQRDSILKSTKSCRHCSQKLSIITSPTIQENNKSTSSKKTSMQSRIDKRNRNSTQNSSSSASSLTSNENSVNSSPKTNTPKTSSPLKTSNSIEEASASALASPIQNEASVQSVIESDTSDTLNETALSTDT